MSDELHEGDHIEMRDGPFKATWRVIGVSDAGARLAYCGDVRFAGYPWPILAPNDDVLTENASEAFLGRAHWRAVQRVDAKYAKLPLIGRERAQIDTLTEWLHDEARRHYDYGRVNSIPRGNTFEVLMSDRRVAKVTVELDRVEEQP